MAIGALRELIRDNEAFRPRCPACNKVCEFDEHGFWCSVHWQVKSERRGNLPEHGDIIGTEEQMQRIHHLKALIDLEKRFGRE